MTWADTSYNFKKQITISNSEVAGDEGAKKIDCTSTGGDAKYKTADFSASGNGDVGTYFNNIRDITGWTDSSPYNVSFYFGFIPREEDSDILLYYNPFGLEDYVSCRASRWDVQNYNVIIETWLNKSDYNTIRDNVRPGAASELYKIFERPINYDQTWEGKNTLRIVPNSNSSSNLKNMRDGEKLIYVKNISSSPLPGAGGWLNVKIEGLISGSGAL